MHFNKNTDFFFFCFLYNLALRFACIRLVTTKALNAQSTLLFNQALAIEKETDSCLYQRYSY